MLTTVNISAEAQKDVKHLKRKYPAVTRQLATLIDELSHQPKVNH
jgi:mRNA-degrading endonuclease RelE of RelBE toxin-antitoxin system